MKQRTRIDEVLEPTPSKDQRAALLALLSHRSCATQGHPGSKGHHGRTIYGFPRDGLHAERICTGGTTRKLVEYGWVRVEERYVTVSAAGCRALARCTKTIPKADRACFEAWAVALERSENR